MKTFFTPIIALLFCAYWVQSFPLIFDVHIATETTYNYSIYEAKKCGGSAEFLDFKISKCANCGKNTTCFPGWNYMCAAIGFKPAEDIPKPRLHITAEWDGVSNDFYNSSVVNRQNPISVEKDNIYWLNICASPKKRIPGKTVVLYTFHVRKDFSDEDEQLCAEARIKW